MSLQQAGATASSAAVHIQSEILTVQEVADWLKMSRRQIYEMTRHRGKVRASDPIPVVRINGNVRFRRSDIEAWLNRLAQSNTVQ